MRLVAVPARAGGRPAAAADDLLVTEDRLRRDRRGRACACTSARSAAASSCSAASCATEPRARARPAARPLPAARLHAVPAGRGRRRRRAGVAARRDAAAAPRSVLNVVLFAAHRACPRSWPARLLRRARRRSTPSARCRSRAGSWPARRSPSRCSRSWASTSSATTSRRATTARR